MDNINIKTSHDQREEKSWKNEIQTGRKAYLENEKELVREKEEIGYGDVAWEEFLEIQPDPEKGQAENSQLLSIQSKFNALQEEKQLLWAEDVVVDELNKKHAAIHIDQFYILTEKRNPIFGGIDFTLENKQSFKNQYENTSIQCSDGKVRTKSDIWLKSHKRRQYNGIVFDPTSECDPCYYNIWKGFAVTPKKGDCSLFWDHIRDNICSGDNNKYLYIRKWIAYVFQHPDEVHTALVLCGKQGTGKNFFVDSIGKLLGHHYLLLSSLSELLSNFNFHLKNAVLIHANEAIWGGNKKEVGALKTMITEQTGVIEGKGKDRITVRNFKHLILSSNEDWPVHIDPDDRRFAIFQVSDARKEDHPYFATIQKQLDNGGYEALLNDLLSEELKEFKPRMLPSNEGSFKIKMLSADSTVQYIYEALKAGGFDIGIPTDPPRFGIISTGSIIKDYQAWCTANSSRSLPSQQFGLALKKFIPTIRKFKPRNLDGVHFIAEEDRRGRPEVYEFPPIEVARKEFQEAFKADEKIWDL